MTRALPLLLLLALFQLSPARSHGNLKNESIAIIGAGYSGLSSAFHLVKKGYTNIVIYEQSYRLGGYAASVRHNNVSHDYTIYGQLASYWRFNEAMESIGITFCPLLFHVVNATTHPPETITLEDFVPRTILPFVGSTDRVMPALQAQIVKYAEIWTRLFGVSYLDDKFRAEKYFARKPKDQATLNELAMPMAAFVEKHGLHLLKDFFIALTDSQAYGVYRSTPAVYHMTWMPPQAFTQLLDNTLPCGKYDSYEAMAGRLGDWLNDHVSFRLGVPVAKVIRRGPGRGVTVVEKDSGARAHFDRVIVTARLPKVQRRPPIVKPVLPSERHVAQTLQELQVYSAVMEADRADALPIRYSAVDYETIKRADNSEWWVVLNAEQRNVSESGRFRNYAKTTRASALFYYDQRDRGVLVKSGSEDRAASLKRNMKKWDDAEWRIVSSRHSNAYFQRWDPAGVRQGLPWAIESIQGRGGVYYVNAGTCGFESVGSVFDCSFHMINGNF